MPSDFIPPKSWRQELKRIATEAGVAAMKFYGSTETVKLKSDQSPLTLADLAAHDVIIKGLESLTMDIPIISEEGDLPSKDERTQWNRFWLVDPLDGTKEFIKQSGEFTVNIALIVNGIPLCGVIFAPAKDLMYSSHCEEGSWKQVGAAEEHRIETAVYVDDEPLRLVMSLSHFSGELEQYTKKYKNIESVSIGSSLKFCLVADGQAHVYPRMGPTMEWDVAAGDCIYRYATKNGQPNPSPLTYNKDTLKNGGFVIGAI